MSDIFANADRYNTSNTFRSDGAGSNRGNIRSSNGNSIGFDCSGLVYHVLRESGYNVPYAASSAMIGKDRFAGDWATVVDSASTQITGGMLVYFDGHVGLVKSYDPLTKMGEFLSMTGSNNSGTLKPAEKFTTSADLNPDIFWGGTRSFRGLAAVKPELYDPALDQHLNGANANTPVFNIPEASNAGFITLPDNGGFAFNKGTKDLSAATQIVIAGQTIAPPLLIDNPVPTTAFAQILAQLESRDQPNNGYGGWLQDGQGIGAIGRYGFRASSLKAIGWMDASGNWTEKASENGVNSPESFRDTPTAQESARVAYMTELKKELKANGSWAMIGQDVQGSTVTEAGLIAAAWKEGAGNVLKFFNGESTNIQKDTNILFRLEQFKNAATTGSMGIVESDRSTFLPITRTFPDGSVQTEYKAKVDSADGSILKGDDVVEVVNDGKVTSRYVMHADASIEQYTDESGVKTYIRWSETGSKTSQISTDPKLNISAETDVGSAMDDSALGRAIDSVNDQGGVAGSLPANALTGSIPLASSLGGVAGSNAPSVGSPNQGNSSGSLSGQSASLLSIARDGLSATFTSGLFIQASNGGRLTLNDKGEILDTRPSEGYELAEHIYDVTTYSKSGQRVSTMQTQLVLDPARPEDPASAVLMVQGQKGEFSHTASDGVISSVKVIFQVGKGWAEEGSGEVLVSLSEWNSRWPIVITGSTGKSPVEPVVATASQEAQDPENPLSVDAVNGSDLQSDQSKSIQPTPMAYRFGAIDGKLYEDIGDGVFTRKIGGHAGWTERRDSTGGGIISDGSGNAVAQLLPGDRLGFMDDGRIVLSDVNGKTVDRLVDIEIAGEFYLANGAKPTEASQKNVDLGSQQVDAEGAKNSLVREYSGAHYRNGMDVQSDGTMQESQTAKTQAALGLINTIIGLQHWDQQSDLSHLSTAVAIYNQINSLSNGSLGNSSGLGSLGGVGAGLGLLSAIDSGNAGGIVVNGIGLADAVFEGAASKAIAQALGLGAGAADGIVPGIGLIIALDSGDPVSIASSGLSLLSALGYIGPWGAAAAVVLSILGGMLEENPDLPMHEGQAKAGWNDAGNLQVTTTQDVLGGGVTATGWMNSIAQGLQHQLASQVDAAGQPIYGLVPQRLPSIGYQYDPDGLNYQSAPGHMVLRWIDDAGTEQTRYYDGAGNRNDGSGETLAADFIKHAQSAGAIVPIWEAQTILAHWHTTAALQGLDVADVQAREAEASGMPQEAVDHLTQVLSALTFEVPAASPMRVGQSVGLIDIDGDGYLEQSQWLQGNQAVLGIDRDGDGIIAAGELLNLSGPGTARNALGWLDANGDGRLDANDPAFAMLRVWLDINQDGASQVAELQTFGGAGIDAIVFDTNPPIILRTDDTASVLTERHLTGDVLGVRYAAVDGGLIEAKELGEVVLHAINTRAFDGDVSHTHGGDEVVDALAELGNDEPALIGAQDARLTSTTVRTLTNRTSANLVSPVLTGAVTIAQAMREVTASMIRSADSSLFGVESAAGPLVALAMGAGAVQWPTVASGHTSAGTEPGTSINFDPSNDRTATSMEVTPNSFSLPPGFVPLSLPVENVSVGPVRTDLYSFQIGHIVNDVQPEAGIFPHGLVGTSNDVALPFIDAQARIDSTPVQSNWSDVTGAVLQEFWLPTNLTGSSAREEIRLAYPAVRGELFFGSEDIGLRIAATTLLANDSTFNTASYPGRPLLSIGAVSAPLHGQVGLGVNAQGEMEVVFIPERNYYGSASFSYTVTDQYGLSATARVSLDLAPVNDAPDAVGEIASGNEDNVLSFSAADLLANDSDVDTQTDGDLLRITRVGLAEHGTALLDSSGIVRFVPDANYNGPAQFTYWVGDRDAASMASGIGLESPATMRLTVLPVNDLPVVTGESIASDEDVVLNIAQDLLLANDTDVDVLTNSQVLGISAVSGAQHGTVTLLADGTIQFTPERDYFGPASFVYTVDDGDGGQVAGTAVINLTSINDLPVVNDELLMGKRDAVYTLTQSTLLANDTDVETPQDLNIVGVLGATHGDAHLNVDASVTFISDAGYSGRGSFQYVIQDADGGQAIGTTEIDFTTVNVNPVAVDDSFTGFEDTAFLIQASQLLVNDLDPDAGSLGSLKVDAVRNALHGTVSLQSDGSVRFDPAPNFFGTTSFEYRVNDGEGGKTWATAVMNVQSINDAPVIEDIFYSMPIYGYRGVIHSDPEIGVTYEYTPVTSEVEARGLSQAGTLYLQNGLQVTSGHYLNGQLRPIAFDPRDAMDDASGATFDDPFRQGGRIVAYDPDGDSAAVSFNIGTTPQHGHAWTNVYTPSSYAPLRPDQAPLYFASEYGAWQYYSHLGDPYSGSDPFSIRVTDGGGASTDALIYSAHSGSPVGSGGGGSCPIVLDLNGDGIKLISAEESNMFADVNADGWRERIGWAENGDGVLTLDANRDGRIDFEEVSFVKYKLGARTDLEGLAGLDDNDDGQLTNEDVVWTQLGVLNDKNGNGQQDTGELQTLSSLGISGIGLRRDGQPYVDHGNVVFGLSSVSFVDGHIGQAADVMFAGEGVALPVSALEALHAVYAPLLPGSDEPVIIQVAPPQPEGQAEADLSRMALVFNQYCARASEYAEPVSYVNWVEARYSELSETEISTAMIQAENFTTLAANQADIRSSV